MSKMKIEIPHDIQRLNEREFRDFVYHLAEEIIYAISNISEENCNKYFLNRIERVEKNGKQK